MILASNPWQILVSGLFLLFCLDGCQHRSLETKDMTDRQAHMQRDTSNFMTAGHVKIDSSSWWEKNDMEVNAQEAVIYMDTQWRLISKDRFMDSVLNYSYGSVSLINAHKEIAYKLKYLGEQGINSQLSPGLAEYAGLSFKQSPKFLFEDLSGNPIDNNVFNGKVVVLNFWFIGCKGCMIEMPFLNDLVAKYKNHDEIIFLAPSYDSRSELGQFLLKNNFDYQVVTVSKENIQQIFKVNTYPTHMIMGKNGEVKHMSTGGSQMAVKMIERQLEGILKTH